MNLVSLAVRSVQSATSTIVRRQLQNVEVHTFYTEAYLSRSTNFLDGPLVEKTATELRLDVNKEHQQEVHHQIAKAQHGRKFIYGT
jgi:hypothetical protein